MNAYNDPQSILQLVEDTKAVACRALWRVKEDDIKGENQFCSKRLKVDDRIIEMEGVQFFVSHITAIEQNVKGKISADEEEGARDPQKYILKFPTSLLTAKPQRALKTQYFVRYTTRIWIPP